MKGRISVLFLIPLAFGIWYFTGMLKHAHAPVTSGSGIPMITSSAVSAAIAYERKQLGCPYVYGGTGPCSAGFDCSGLTQQAYRAAGIGIPRTSEEQWAQLKHVSTPRIGDLVFFTGASIDPPPGHVGLVIGKNKMIEAYATGVPVRVSTFGLANSAPGDGTPTGYAEP